MQNVIIINEDEIINDYPDDTVLFEKGSWTYIKIDKSIVLNGIRTFKDAVLNEYKNVAHIGEVDKTETYEKYYDHINEQKILEILNERERLETLRAQEVNSKDLTLTYSALKNDFSDFNFTKSLDLTNFNLIYVNDTYGNDNNDGSQNSPVKTIRRAERLINGRTKILISPGIYNLSFDNKNTNKNFCESGIANKRDGDGFFEVEYLNMSLNPDSVKFLIYGDAKNDARDLACINGVNDKETQTKLTNISFKIIDNKRKISNSVAIVRMSDNILFENCVFEIISNNISIVHNTIQESNIKFINCFFNIESVTGVIKSASKGSYELIDCVFNLAAEEILLNDSKEDTSNNVLTSQINTRFFNKNQ